jgi:hypothetical protein
MEECVLIQRALRGPARSAVYPSLSQIPAVLGG